MIIIDGYNLFYSRNDIKSAEDLIYKMQIFCDVHQRKVILVFDGEWDYQGEYNTKFLTVIYTDDADQYIINLMKKFPRSIVVTSDRDIRKYAKQYKTKIIRSKNYLFDQSEFEKQELYVSQDDIDEYLKLLKNKTSRK